MTRERAYFLIENFPRIEDGVGSFREWVEIFPGVRVWWHEETYSDNDLLNATKDKEHFYALRWYEIRSRRLNSGCVCELEIIPEETERHFEEMGLSDMIENEISVQNLNSILTSFGILLVGYNDQIRICGALNYSWRHFNHEREFPVVFEINSEISNDERLLEHFRAESMESDAWESFLPSLWDSGYLLFFDKTGRYSDFLEFYTLAMHTEDPLERNARFCRCIETLIRKSERISHHLRSRTPLLCAWNSNEDLLKHTEEVYSKEEQIEFAELLIKRSWEMRSKYWHGQSIKNKHHQTINWCISCWPSLLYWVNLGLVILGRVPSEEEFEEGIKNERLNWDIPIKWGPHDWDIMEDWLYRIDGTYQPEIVQKFKLEHPSDNYTGNRFTYLEFLENIE